MLLMAWIILLIMSLSYRWTKVLLPISETTLLIVWQMLLIMLLAYSELGLRGLMLIPTAMLLSSTPDGEIAAIPPMTAVERKSYTTTFTINSRQRPPLNDFPHLGNTPVSEQFLFDLRVAGRLRQVSPRFLVISHELLTVDRNEKVTVLTANHVDRAGGI